MDLKQQTALAQVIHNAYWAMEAGTYPTKDQEQEVNAGDLQLAYEILTHFNITPKETN